MDEACTQNSYADEHAMPFDVDDNTDDGPREPARILPFQQPIVHDDPDVHHAQGQHKPITWANPNSEIISRLCNRLCLADRQCNVLLEELQLLSTAYPIVRHVRALRKEEKVAFKSANLSMYKCPIVQPLGINNEPMLERDTYELVLYDVLTVCETLINIKEHIPYIHWHYEEDRSCDGIESDSAGDMRFYSQLWTTNWWKEEELSLPVARGNILSVMFASDETHVTLTGRKMHPIYIFLGNYHRRFKDQQSGWSLLGFQPVIRTNKGYGQRSAIGEYRREVKRWVMDTLVKDIITNRDGFMMRCSNVDGTSHHRWVYPRMPFFVGDEPELMSSITNGYRGACHRPCTNCMVCPSQWEPIPDKPYVSPLMATGPPRAVDDVTIYFNWDNRTSTMTRDVSEELSVHSEFNSLFDVPGLNPFNNPSCRMHQTDHGVFKNLLDLTVRFYKKFGPRGSVNIFNTRWAALRKYPGMKQFHRGVSDLSYVTANHHRWMSMCLPFVCRGLDDTIDTAISGLPKKVRMCQNLRHPPPTSQRAKTTGSAPGLN
jgi:Plavaka transposase